MIQGQEDFEIAFFDKNFSAPFLKTTEQISNALHNV